MTLNFLHETFPTSGLISNAEREGGENAFGLRRVFHTTSLEEVNTPIAVVQVETKYRTGEGSRERRDGKPQFSHFVHLSTTFSYPLALFRET